MKSKNIKIASTIILALLFAGMMANTIVFRGIGSFDQQSQPRTIPQATPIPLALTLQLNADGATFPQLLISQYINNYHLLHPNVTITYTGTGSGKGQRDFINKTMDFTASDAPLNAGQRILAPNALHIPETIGSVTAAYNLPGNATGVVNFDGPTLANIYLGNIVNWNDSAIRALNPGLKLPNQTIKVVYRSESSGTSFVWTSYLSAVSSTWSTTPLLGPSTAGPGYPWPVGIGATGNLGVANYVNTTAYAIGYVELAYVITHALTVAKVKNPAGNYIFPTEQTTASAVADSSQNLPPGDGDWSSVSLLLAPGTNDYPIASFSYFLVYKELNVVPSMDLVDNVQAQTIKDFLNYAITTGQGFGPSLGFVPLPASVVTLDQTTINSITFTHTSTPVTSTLNLSASSTGWSQTSITVTTNDTINFNLISLDGLKHQWYIDFDNNGVLDPNENWTTVSPFFSSATTPVTWAFHPIIWFQEGIPAAGTYTFRDSQNAALTGTIVVRPQQTAAVLKPGSSLTSTLAPVLDTSRVSTIGTLVIDQRTKTVSGLVSAVAVDKTSGSTTYIKTYNIPNLKMLTVQGSTDLKLSFVLNLAVLNGATPQALSTDVTVTLHNDYTAATDRLLSRELDFAAQGSVNILDLAAVAIHYGALIGQPNYDPTADVTADGVINILDLALVAIFFGAPAFR